jgi:hypothetical protein
VQAKTLTLAPLRDIRAGGKGHRKNQDTPDLFEGKRSTRKLKTRRRKKMKTLSIPLTSQKSLKPIKKEEGIMKKIVIAICFTLVMSFIASTVMAQDISWRKVGHPWAARKIAGCSDGSIYALNHDKTLWVNRDRGTDSAWRFVHRLPADTNNITCAANNIYFQKNSRELWERTEGGELRRVGYPHAAAEISGSTDFSGFPVIWALNDDRTLWYNSWGGDDANWTKVGRPVSADKIASAGDDIYALNDNKTFWRNRRGGRNNSWEYLDTPFAAVEIAAASAGPSTQPRIYALNDDYTLWEGEVTKWNIQLNRLRVRDAREDAWSSDGDEPYFIMINFRSRFDTPGSTQVFTNRYQNDHWAEGIDSGGRKNIPKSMGLASFENVDILSINDILYGGMNPEIMGSIVIAMESNATDWSDIRPYTRRIESSVTRELVDLIENNTIYEIDAGDVSDAINQVIADMQPSLEESLRIFMSSFFDPDRLIGMHTFLFVASEPIETSLPSFPNTTIGFLQRLEPLLPALDFRGEGAHYKVDASIY